MYHPDSKNRRSIRLKGYDYTKPGIYYVTICTQNKRALLGDINDGAVELSDTGRMIKKIWEELPLKYQGVEIDEFIVMPNHLHGIIILNLSVEPLTCSDDRTIKGQPQGAC
jgi:putative transposase